MPKKYSKNNELDPQTLTHFKNDLSVWPLSAALDLLGSLITTEGLRDGDPFSMFTFLCLCCLLSVSEKHIQFTANGIRSANKSAAKRHLVLLVTCH